jgi:uncharacterized membrane protein YvbJ
MEDKFCHSCGTKISNNSTFCTNCGAKQNADISNAKKNKDSSNSNVKPFYLKPAFIIFIIIVLLAIYANLTEEKKVWNGAEFVPQSQYDKEIRNR